MITDSFLLEKLNNFVGRYYFLDFFVILFAGYVGYVLVAAVLLVWFLKKDTVVRRLMLSAMISAVISRFVFAELIRFLYDRPRPFEVLDIIQLVRHSSGHSFPSGHAAFFFALSVGVWFYNKKAGLTFLITSTLIGLARVYSGIHWPSDILAGALTGIITAFLSRNFLQNRLCDNKNPQTGHY